MSPNYSDKYLQGLGLFNKEEFFECHDVLEELWSRIQGKERRFYQGLIQASVALFHFGNKNYGGARKLYYAARQKLEEYDSPFLGLDLDRFLNDFQQCFQELLDAKEFPTDLELNRQLIPKIKMPTVL